MIRKKSTFQYLNIGSKDVFECDCMHCMYLYLLSSYQSRVRTQQTQNPDLADSEWTLGYIDYGQRHHDGRIVQTWMMIIVIMMDICSTWMMCNASMHIVHCTWFGCVRCGTNFWTHRGRERKTRRFRKMFLVNPWMSSVYKIFGIVAYHTSGFAMCFQINWKPQYLLPNNLNQIVTTDHICWKAILKSHKNHQVLFWKSENFDFFPCSTLAIICTRRFMKHKLRFLDAWMCYFWFGYPVRKGRLVLYGVAMNLRNSEGKITFEWPCKRAGGGIA